MTRMAKLLGTAALVLAAGCSSTGSISGNDAAPVDGDLQLDGNLQISAASDSDKVNLCNWFAGMVGGYGAAPTCSMALLTAPPSEATCVSEFPSCAVPVSAFKACVLTVISAQETCTQASIMMAQQDPNCVTVGSAGCFK
jgi:hypothetical protein